MDSRLESIILRMSNIIRNVIERVTKLEDLAHPPRDFTICDECKCKVVITEHIEERRK